MADDAVTRGMRALLARRDGELADGAHQVGWKIGFNTAAIQQALGLSDPVVGYLLDRGVTADGATVSLAGWTAPAVEVEVAVRVGDDGGVAGLAPALELVDLDVSFADIEPVLAANICQRGVVFGDEVPGVDPWAVVANVTRERTAGRRRRRRGRRGVGPAGRPGGPHQPGPCRDGGLRPVLPRRPRVVPRAGPPHHRGFGCSSIAVAPGDSLDVDFGPLGRLSVRFTR